MPLCWFIFVGASFSVNVFFYGHALSSTQYNVQKTMQQLDFFLMWAVYKL